MTSSNNNNNKETYLSLGNSLEIQNKYKEAIDIYNEAIKLDQNYLQAHFNKGACLKDLGKLEEAIDCFSQTIKIDPSHKEAHFQKGNCLRLLTKDYKAIDGCNEVSKVDHTSLDEAMNFNDKEADTIQGNHLKDSVKFEYAIQSYNEAIKLDQNYKLAYFYKATCQKKLGELEEAITSYSEVIKLDQNYKIAYSNKGFCQQKLGKLEEAIDNYNEAIKLNPNYKLAYFNKGICQQKLGKLEEAIESFNQTIRVDSNGKEAHKLKGDCLKDQGKYEEAIHTYNEAICLDKNYKIAYFNKGICQQKLGKLEEAIDSFNETIRIDLNDKEAHVWKGFCLRDLGQNDEAINIYNEIIKIDKNYKLAYYYKGICLKKLGKLEEAIDSFNETIRIDSNDKEAHVWKGICLRDLGKNQEAIYSFDVVTKIDPFYILAYAHKGQMLQAQGQDQQSIECIKICSKLLNEGHTKGLSKGNLAFIKRIVKQLEKIERENKSILENVYKLKGNENEKQKIQKAAEKFVQLINKTSQDKMLKNFVKLEDEQQEQQSQEQDNSQRELYQIEIQQKQVIEKIQDENQTNEEKIQFIENLLKNMDQKYCQMLSQQREQIENVQADIKQINIDLKDGGVQEKAIIQRELQKLQDEEEESVFNYYKIFYWAVLNMFQTYRVISSKLVNGNYKDIYPNYVQENQEAISKGIKIGLDVGKEICKGVIKVVPIAGNIFSILDNFVDKVLQAGAAYTDKKNKITFQNRVNSINNIITQKFISEEDISIKLSQAAIKITKIRRNIINMPKSDDSQQKQSILNWLKEQIQNIDDSIFEKTELHEKNNQGVQQALQDVILLMSYLYLNSNNIINLKKKDISDIIVDVIEKNSDAHLQKDFPKRIRKNSSTKNSRKDDCFGCSIF